MSCFNKLEISSFVRDFPPFKLVLERRNHEGVKEKVISQVEMAKRLDVTTRQVRRLKKSYEMYGVIELFVFHIEFDILTLFDFSFQYR